MTRVRNTEDRVFDYWKNNHRNSKIGARWNEARARRRNGSLAPKTKALREAEKRAVEARGTIGQILALGSFEAIRVDLRKLLVREKHSSF